MIVLICIAVFVILLVIGVSSFNKIKMLQQDVKSSYAQIDVQLKRRNDLIPNLLNTVKGYMKHERETLESVIAARNGVADAQSGGNLEEISRASAELSKGVNKIMALAESYPELKADKLFKSLQDELVSTENKISYVRQQYNATVDAHNTCITTLPHLFFAGLAKAEEAKYLEIPESEKVAPVINFDI